MLLLLRLVDAEDGEDATEGVALAVAVDGAAAGGL